MKIGFLTNFLAKRGMSTLNEIADWAVENGFTDLEVGPTVPMDMEAFENVMGRDNITITALTYCRNYLSTDTDEAQLHITELKKRIDFAGQLGIEKIVTSTGIDKTLEEGIYDKADAIRKIPIRSMDKFVTTFDPIIDYSEKRGVKLAFENCPLMGNIAISPVMWNEIFNRIKSNMIGLAYDPSHLIWEFIDPYSPIKEFKNKIFHVHMKDTEIDRVRLSQCGILTDFSWWKYRIPGHGELDWERLIKELKDIGYNKTLSIEHEDPDYEDTLDLVKEGLILGKDMINDCLRRNSL